MAGYSSYAAYAAALGVPSSTPTYATSSPYAYTSPYNTAPSYTSSSGYYSGYVAPTAPATNWGITQSQYEAAKNAYLNKTYSAPYAAARSEEYGNMSQAYKSLAQYGSPQVATGRIGGMTSAATPKLSNYYDTKPTTNLQNMLSQWMSKPFWENTLTNAGTPTPYKPTATPFPVREGLWGAIDTLTPQNEPWGGSLFGWGNPAVPPGYGTQETPATPGVTGTEWMSPQQLADYNNKGYRQNATGVPATTQETPFDWANNLYAPVSQESNQIYKGFATENTPGIFTPSTPDLSTSKGRDTFLNNVRSLSQADADRSIAMYTKGDDPGLQFILNNLAKDGKAVTVTPERMNAITDNKILRDLDRIGYKQPKAIQEFVDFVKSAQGALGDLFVFNPADSEFLTWDVRENIIKELQSKYNSTNMQSLADKGKGISFEGYIEGMDVFGNPIIKGKLNVVTLPTPPEKKLEKPYPEPKVPIPLSAQYEEYWLPENVEQRNLQREESAAYQEQKNLEGYKEFYAFLDNSKLPAAEDQYFRNNFAELRRLWQTSDLGLTWDAWLAQYDFSGEWYKKSPYQRGERPAVFAPRMRTVSY